MGFGKLGIVLENGAFPRRIWDEEWESWRKKMMKLLLDVLSLRYICGNIPIEMGKRQLGDGPGSESILVGNTDMGDCKTMVCSNKVTKR